MGIRGKHSTADLEPVRALQARLEPPADLTPAQRERWLAITGSLPPDWFRPGDLSLLRAYCIAEALSLQAAASLETEGIVIADGNRNRANPAVQVFQAATGAMASLSVKLRLCPSSRYEPRTAATARSRASPKAARPWDDVDAA